MNEMYIMRRRSTGDSEHWRFSSNTECSRGNRCSGGNRSGSIHVGQASGPKVSGTRTGALVKGQSRKPIAMAVDYEQINEGAVTGQSPTFAEVPRSVMNATDAEQKIDFRV